MWTIMYTNTQVFFDKHTTTRTTLACVTRVNSQEQSTGTRRLVGRELCKLIPSNISNTLVQFVAKDYSVILHHSRNVQIFKDNHAIGVDQLAGSLMRKIGTLVSNTFVDARDNLLALGSFWRAFCFLFKPTLCFRQFFSITSEKSRVINLFPIAQGCKARQSNVNTNSSCFIRQWLYFALTSERGKPLSCRRTADSDCLGRATEFSVQRNLDTTEFTQAELVANQLNAVAVLWVSHRVITPVPLKSGVTRFFTRLDTAKKCLKRQVNTHSDILQNLGMNNFERWFFRLPFGQHFLGIVIAQRNTVQLMTFLAGLKGLVVYPSTLFQHFGENCPLSRSWVNTIPIRFHGLSITRLSEMRKYSITLKTACVQWLKNIGFTPKET